MGWMRTLLLGDIGNRLDIRDTEDDIAQLRFARREESRLQAERDENQDHRIARLEERVVQLEVGVATLARLLVRNGTVPADELAQLVQRLEQDETAAGHSE